MGPVRRGVRAVGGAPVTRVGRCALVLAATFGLVAPRVATATAIVVPDDGGTARSGAAMDALRRDLDAIVAHAELGPAGAHVGVLAIDARDGRDLYAREADAAFQPASSLKLLVGAVALDRLGPAATFTTRAYLAPAAGGYATLRVVGGGDPFLGAADVTSLAAAVAVSGARVLDVIVDASRFGGLPTPAGWEIDDEGQDYAAPISAASVDGDLLHLALGGPLIGGRLPVAWTPAVSGDVAPDVVCDARVRAASVVIDAGPVASAENAVDPDVGPGASGCLVVTGRLVPSAAATSLDVALPDPPRYLRAAIVAALGKAGVTGPYLGAPWQPGTPLGAGGRFVWVHVSPPLAATLGPRFWIPSDNTVAETWLRELAVGPGIAGTTPGGLALERTWLRGIGVDPATATLADGSGLSQYDRIPPRALVGVLRRMWAGPNRRLVLDSLPVGGARGTIEGLAGTAVAGRVFAKTGSMSHVRALAGYLATPAHGTVIFAIMVDDWLGESPGLVDMRAKLLTRLAADP